MKAIIFLLLPPLLFALSREECAHRLEKFTPLEKAYDAVLQSKIAAPYSEETIRRFRKEAGQIYTLCKDRMSTTRWYMLGKKAKDDKVDLRQFHLESANDLKNYAISHPPVIVKYLCGSIRQGTHLPAR